MTSKEALEYLEQLAKTEVIDCTYNDKAKKTIGQIFPVGIAEIQKDLEALETIKDNCGLVYEDGNTYFMVKIREYDYLRRLFL